MTPMYSHSFKESRIIRSEFATDDVDSHWYSSFYEVIFPKYNGTCDKYETLWWRQGCEQVGLGGETICWRNKERITNYPQRQVLLIIPLFSEMYYQTDPFTSLPQSRTAPYYPHPDLRAALKARSSTEI